MSTEKPNILFFFADDQRFNTIHALGNEEVHTPTLDRLVERGTTFTHAHIPGGQVGAICMPSRAMLHTSRTLFHLQEAGRTVPEDHTMMGEHLQRQGYRTFGTGKWHNGPAAFARSFSDGGEIFFGGMDDHWNVPAFDFDPSGQYDTTLPIIKDPWGSRDVVLRQGTHVTAGKHSSELFCEAAIDFIEGYDADDPFFTYISFMAPHDPRSMPEEFLNMYDPEKIILPENFAGAHPFDNGDLKIRDEVLEDFPRLPEKVRVHIAEYFAMITHLDAQMARVLKALEDSGKADNTIVVFAGDNGLAVGQHGLFGKQNMYEHSVRVPMILCGPGIPENQKRDAYVYVLDLFPTLCDLTDIPVPDSVEGSSFVRAIRSDEPARESL